MRPAFIIALLAAAAQAQSVTVTGSVAVVRQGRPRAEKSDNAYAVVWLKPAGAVHAEGGPPAVRPRFTIRQHNKRFDPHVLAVPVGSVVDFPNLDPFFHNVFSMFDGKRFDLGLYEAGASHAVNFDRAGICYIFCNIHPEMSAAVVVVDTPYYAVSNASGEIAIPNVPPGRYQLHVWHERAKPETREISVTAQEPSLGRITLIDSGQFAVQHKNKYGQDYERPAGLYK